MGAVRILIAVIFAMIAVPPAASAPSDSAILSGASYVDDKLVLEDAVVGQPELRGEPGVEREVEVARPVRHGAIGVEPAESATSLEVGAPDAQAPGPAR